MTLSSPSPHSEHACRPGDITHKDTPEGQAFRHRIRQIIPGATDAALTLALTEPNGGHPQTGSPEALLLDAVRWLREHGY